MHLLNVAIPGEFCSREAPIAHAALFMCALDAKLHRPERPGRQGRTLLWRHRHDLELLHGTRFLPVARSKAIGARVAPSVNDHALAGFQNLRVRVDRVAQIPAYAPPCVLPPAISALP